MVRRGMMDIIIIVLIIWFAISKANKNQKKNTKRDTVLNGKPVNTGSRNANAAAYYKQSAKNAANSRNMVQNSGYQQRPAQNQGYGKLPASGRYQQGNQQELKRRLQQKYGNAVPQGNTYQKPVQQTDDILSRAKSNVREMDKDSLKQEMLEQSAGGVYTADGVMKKAIKKTEEPQLGVNNVCGYTGVVDINQESDILKQVNDLIVMGYSGDLSFERDFIAEGVEMLNSYEI